MADPQIRIRRRLIVCMDGTMNDGINTDKPLTNVARFARCVTTGHFTDETGFVVIQIPFYMAGIGTGPSQISKYIDAFYGRGIHHDIREAYTFICANYEAEDDEIVLVGFSRGAFAARALSFLLDKLGVLRKAGLKHLDILYQKWKTSYRSENNAEAESEWKKVRDQLEQKKLLFKAPRIKACAVWDTVAALPKDELSFVNQKIPGRVELAVHALALNEERTQYTPLLWHEDAPRTPPRLHQCWFLGSHSDVGGGHSYPHLANIALAWVISRLRDRVFFSEDAIFDLTLNYETGFNLDPLRWCIKSEGNLHCRVRFHLPLQEFQSKTDTHVGWFAWAQRVTGWGSRHALSSGDNAHERVHWSVQKLLREKIVRTCYPLEMDNTARYPIESSSEFEEHVLESWIARQTYEIFRQMTIAKIEGVKPAHTIQFQTYCLTSNGRVSDFFFGWTANEMLSLALATVPIYAVLWQADTNKPDRYWSVETKDTYSPFVSIKVDSNPKTDKATLCTKMHNGRDYEKNILGKEYPGPTSTLGLLAQFRRSIPIPRAFPTLTGYIDVPFDQVSDLAGNHDT